MPLDSRTWQEVSEKEARVVLFLGGALYAKLQDTPKYPEQQPFEIDMVHSASFVADTLGSGYGLQYYIKRDSDNEEIDEQGD